MKLLGAICIDTREHLAVYVCEPSDNDLDHGAILIRTGCATVQIPMLSDQARHLGLLLTEGADYLDKASGRPEAIVALLTEPGRGL